MALMDGHYLGRVFWATHEIDGGKICRFLSKDLILIKKSILLLKKLVMLDKQCIFIFVPLCLCG